VADAVVMQGVSKQFRSGGRWLQVLRGVDLVMRQTELVVVSGRSGSGKTTLLSLIGGLDRPDEGKICVAGLDVGRLCEVELERFRLQTVSWVFQTAGLHPLLTAVENVALPLQIRGTAAAPATRIALAALEEVGLESRHAHRAHELSGGEQQRVALARALAKQPRILLADEPTAQLDSATAKGVMTLIRSVSQVGIAVLIASHDPALAGMADRCVRLVDGRLD